MLFFSVRMKLPKLIPPKLLKVFPKSSVVWAGLTVSLIFHLNDVFREKFYWSNNFYYNMIKRGWVEGLTHCRNFFQTVVGKSSMSFFNTRKNGKWSNEF